MIFLFATELEAQKFRSACPQAHIVICGVGAAECAATTATLIASLKEQKSPKTLILCGIAGSYSLHDVAIGEVVEVIQEEIEALPERFRRRYRQEPHTALRAVTSNSVDSRYMGAANAQIENMEGATFMALCSRAEVPHIQIRAISNLVADPFELWQVDKACTALCSTLEYYFKK